MICSFCLMMLTGSIPSPQSGARISLSGGMNLRASLTLPTTSSSVSTLVLATVTDPRMTLVRWNRASRDRSLSASAFSMETSSNPRESILGARRL